MIIGSSSLISVVWSSWHFLVDINKREQLKGWFAKYEPEFSIKVSVQFPQTLYMYTNALLSYFYFGYKSKFEAISSRVFKINNQATNARKILSNPMKNLKEYFLGLKQHLTKNKAKYGPLNNASNMTPTKQFPQRIESVTDGEDSYTMQGNIQDYIQVNMELRYASNLNI